MSWRCVAAGDVGALADQARQRLAELDDAPVFGRLEELRLQVLFVVTSRARCLLTSHAVGLARRTWRTLDAIACARLSSGR